MAILYRGGSLPFGNPQFIAIFAFMARSGPNGIMLVVPPGIIGELKPHT